MSLRNILPDFSMGTCVLYIYVINYFLSTYSTMHHNVVLCHSYNHCYIITPTLEAIFRAGFIFIITYIWLHDMHSNEGMEIVSINLKLVAPPH
jgi:glycerol uptake facilitator-like aquaporin